MSNEERLPNELNELEDALRGLRPQPPSLSRDELMYRAGWAAAEAQHDLRRSVGSWLWPASTAAMTAATLTLAIVVARGKAPVVVVQQAAEKVVEVTPVESDASSRPQEAAPAMNDEPAQPTSTPPPSAQPLATPPPTTPPNDWRGDLWRLAGGLTSPPVEDRTNYLTLRRDVLLHGVDSLPEQRPDVGAATMTRRPPPTSRELLKELLPPRRGERASGAPEDGGASSHEPRSKEPIA